MQIKMIELRNGKRKRKKLDQGKKLMLGKISH